MGKFMIDDRRTKEGVGIRPKEEQVARLGLQQTAVPVGWADERDQPNRPADRCTSPIDERLEREPAVGEVEAL